MSNEYYQDWAEPTYNNTAGRLLAVIERFQSQADGINAHAAWRRVLFKNDEDLAPGTTLEIADRVRLADELHKLFHSVCEVEAEYKETHPDFPSAFDKDFANLKLFFSMERLTEHVSQSKKYANGSAVTHLKNCAINTAKEQPVAADNIKQMMDMTADLMTMVRASKMAPQLKKSMLAILENVYNSLVHYWLYGRKEMEAALERLVGGVYLHGAEIDKTPDGDGIFDKLSTLASRIAAVVYTAEKIQKIVEYCTKNAPAVVALYEGVKNLTGS